MRRFIPLAIFAAMLLGAYGCASASKAGKDFEPSSINEPPSVPQVDPAKPALPGPPAPAAPAASKDAKPNEPTPAELENKPLPVLPSDPPPPQNAEDLGDDGWGRDQRHTKLKDKDRDRVKSSGPEDDGWGKE